MTVSVTISLPHSSRCFRAFQIFECFKEIFLSYPQSLPLISLPTLEDEDQSLGCAIDWTFVSPSHKCMCWNLTPNVLAFGGRDFGMCLGHEGRALIIELVPLKEKPENNRRKTDVYEPESRASPDTESANTLTLDFPFRIVRNSCCS